METLSEAGQKIAGCTHGCEEAIRSPRPVTNDGVDESGDADRVEQIANETGSTDHCTGRDGGAGVSKRELKDPDGKECHACRLIRFRRALEEEPVIADEAVAMAEHEGEPDGVE